MKKLKNLWNKIPRPCRAFFNLTLAFVVATIFYVSIGSPALSRTHQFRRIERANLVGPSTILFDEKVGIYSNAHLIVAETEQNIFTFVTEDIFVSRFNCFKRTGDITVVSAPKQGFLWGSEYFAVDLPVFVIDTHPGATHAELKLSVKGTFEHNLNGVHYSETLDQYFSAESKREEDGIFCFVLSLPFIEPLDNYGNFLDVGHGADGFALDALAYAFTNIRPQHFNGTITAIVCLYDDNDNLIAERELLLDPNSRYWE